MNVNFELYKIFYVVANNESISKGAMELSISQPAVTQAIHSLEGQLGIDLFIRTKKGVVLTEEGKELYEYVKEGMNYFNNGYNKLLSLKNLECGVIKIGASTSITEHYLMPYINEFHKLYPNIEIKIINNLTDDLYKNLKNGNIDIVISNEICNSDLNFNFLCDVNEIFVSNVPLKLNIEEILGEKIIIQVLPSVTRKAFDEFVKENNLNFIPYMEVVSHRLVTEFVKNGLGIGVVTKQFVMSDLNRNLFEVETNVSLPKRKIGYVIKNNHIPPSSVKKFIEILKNK